MGLELGLVNFLDFLELQVYEDTIYKRSLSLNKLHLVMDIPLLFCFLSSLTTIHGSDVYANMHTPFAFIGGKLD